MQLPRHIFPVWTVRLFQPKLGENPNQSHDGDHPADDVHNQVGFIHGGLRRHVHLRRGSAGHHPRRGVIVLTGGLVQARALERAAEPKATGAAAVQVVARPAHERRIPLAHHVVVAPALLLRVGALRGHALPLRGVVEPDEHEVVRALIQLALRVTNQNFHQKVAEQQLSASHGCSLSDALKIKVSWGRQHLVKRRCAALLRKDKQG